MDTESFVEYSERFDFFLAAGNVTDAGRKRALFLANVGAKAYKVLRNLVGEQISSKPYAELVKTLRDHLEPTPNIIAQRYHFYKRDRKNGEGVNEFIAELRRLSEHCGFGENIDDYLRDSVGLWVEFGEYSTEVVNNQGPEIGYSP